MRRRSSELLALEPEVVVVATVARSARACSPSGRSRPGRTCCVEKPAGLGDGADRPARRAAERPARPCKVGFNHRFHPGHRARRRRGRIGAARRAHARPRPLRARRTPRVRPRVAGRPGALGRRRAGRPGHAPARPRPLARRAAAAALGAAAHAVLGHAGRGQRGADARRARSRTAPWAMLHVSWTEWKNMFSLEIYCRTRSSRSTGSSARTVRRRFASIA